jgi:hypothetical protein
VRGACSYRTGPRARLRSRSRPTAGRRHPRLPS